MNTHQIPVKQTHAVPSQAAADHGSWQVRTTQPGEIALLPSPLEIGGASLPRTTVLPISDTKWREFGDWCGIKKDALPSWGFLKHVARTIGFDEQHFLFDEL